MGSNSPDLKLPRAEVERFLSEVPFNRKGKRTLKAAQIPVPAMPVLETKGKATTQAGFRSHPRRDRARRAALSPTAS